MEVLTNPHSHAKHRAETSSSQPGASPKHPAASKLEKGETNKCRWHGTNSTLLIHALMNAASLLIIDEL